MQTKIRKILAVLTLGMTSAVGASSARADEYPIKPIRLIVPYPAGGTIDTVSRLLAPNIASQMKQAVIIENKPGGGTILGTVAAANAAPDGYTVLLGSNSAFTIAPNLQAKLAYDPVRSFNAITMLVTLPNVLAVKAESPYRTLTDVVAAARQAPGKMNYASLGIGTTSHLSGEALKAAAGIDVAHVPYSGAGTALTSVMRGDTDYYFDTMFAAVPQVKANRLRILAVTSSRRAPSMPDIPTIIEAGVPKVDVTAWIAVFVPAGVPADIQKRLMQAFNTAKGVPEIRKRIIELGGEPSDTDASGVRQMIEIEGERFGKLVKHANIQAE